MSAAFAHGWPWLALAGAGAFHGLNPAMGWLFAVALGLHGGGRRAVLMALPAIALGHLLSITLVAGLAVLVGVAVSPHQLLIAAGVLLIGWAVWHATLGRRHRVRIGLRTGLAGLTLWSFLMASAHGAGLMLLPALLPLCLAHGPLGHLSASGSLPVLLAAVTAHTLAMLAVAGTIAMAVYEWVGLKILRSGWINFDRIWTLALAAAGTALLLA